MPARPPSGAPPRCRPGRASAPRSTGASAPRRRSGLPTDQAAHHHQHSQAGSYPSQPTAGQAGGAGRRQRQPAPARSCRAASLPQRARRAQSPRAESAAPSADSRAQSPAPDPASRGARPPYRPTGLRADARARRRRPNGGLPRRGAPCDLPERQRDPRTVPCVRLQRKRRPPKEVRLDDPDLQKRSMEEVISASSTGSDDEQPCDRTSYAPCRGRRG